MFSELYFWPESRSSEKSVRYLLENCKAGRLRPFILVNEMT